MCVCVFFVGICSEQSLHFLLADMSEIMTGLVLFFSFSACNRTFSSGPLVKKHDSHKRLMRTSVPNKKVTGNNQTYIMKKKKAERNNRDTNLIENFCWQVFAEVLTRKLTGRCGFRKTQSQ